ncbi:MAG: MFS transporter [Sciscionella sp.]
MTATHTPSRARRTVLTTMCAGYFLVLLFSDRRFALSNAGALVMNGSCQGMLYLTTLLLQLVQGRGPLLAGLAALPLFLPLMLLPTRAGRLVARFGPLRVAAAALLLTAVGIGLLAVIGGDTPYPVMAVIFPLWGCGLGILTPALVTGAVGAAPVAMSGLASAVNNAARQAGGSVGVAVCAGLAGLVAATGFLSGFRLAELLMAAMCLLAAAALVTGSLARGTLRGL